MLTYRAFIDTHSHSVLVMGISSGLMMDTPPDGKGDKEKLLGGMMVKKLFGITCSRASRCKCKKAPSPVRYRLQFGAQGA